MWSTTESRIARPQPYIRALVSAFARLAIGIGLALPLILFWTAWQQARLYSEQTAEELAAILADDARYALLVGSRPDAQVLVSSLMKFPDLIRVQLLDGQGRVVAEERAASQVPAKRTLQVATPVLTEDREPSSKVQADATHSSDPLGRVVLSLSLDRAYAFARDTAQASLLQLGLLTVVLGVAVARLSLRLLAPLGTLVGHLGDPLETALPPPPARSPTEVYRLYAAIADMRTRLAESHRQLAAYALELESKVDARTQDLRAACEAAEAANRAKTLFLANVSHELRTPLQAIILHARLLERAQPDHGGEALAIIQRASTQLLELIEQLLNLAKVESGQPLELTYQAFELPALLEEVATTLRPTLTPHNRLELALPETSLRLISDRARLTQVLYNLIRNADKFTQDGVIRLSLEPIQDGEQAQIRVSDQGVGIAAPELERIFEPFYQGANGIAGSISSGIGLGLWLSRRLIEGLGGSIAVTSEAGVGSCFRVLLPLAPTLWAESPSRLRAVLETPPVSDSARYHGTRLLLAEDEDSIRTPLALFLREAGFGVDECVDGTAALALLARGLSGYAGVILDHRMPGCQGLDILEWLRADRQSTTPVVILTGDDRAPLQTAIRRLDAQLMVKPILPERLIETIAALIDPPGSEDPTTKG